MNSSAEYSVSDIGTVLVRARLQTTEVFGSTRVFWQALSKAAIQEMRVQESKPDKHRMLAAPDFLRSALWSAFFSSCCYFDYYSMFISLADASNFNDINQASIDAAHIHADVVPIDLYNALKISQSLEVCKISKLNPSDFEALFVLCFPRLKDARDAVAHSHDRLFSRRYDKPIDAEIGSRSLSLKGKYYVDGNGHDFLFDFRPDNFLSLLKKMERILTS